MIIKVKTIPKSNISEIEKVSEKEYIAHIKSSPINNKANIELINLLSKEFSVPHKQIKIKNPTSRKKIIDIN